MDITCMVPAHIGMIIKRSIRTAHYKKKLRGFLRHPYSIQTIVNGVRPCLLDRQAIGMFSDQYPGIGCINGMRGQGLFLAPNVVTLFCNELCRRKSMKTKVPQ